MSFDALNALRQAGVVNSKTAQPALDVLSTLSEEETQMLSSLNARLQAAISPEVVAHSEEGDEDAACLVAFSCTTGFSGSLE